MCIFSVSLSGFGIMSQGRERGTAVAALPLLGKGSPAEPDKERGGLGTGVAAAKRFDVSAMKRFSKK